MTTEINTYYMEHLVPTLSDSEKQRKANEILAILKNGEARRDTEHQAIDPTFDPVYCKIGDKIYHVIYNKQENRLHIYQDPKYDDLTMSKEFANLPKYDFPIKGELEAKLL